MTADSNPNPASGLRRFASPAVIVLAAVVAVIPELLRGNSCGHDFDVHLVSWFDCLNAWKHGIVYPHWTPSANYGAGEPRFVFYPPFTWVLGAALAVLLPWTAVPVALTGLIFAATGLATRALARLVLSDTQSTLAGCVAIFSGYTLFTGYERTAFPEFAGGFWLPLLMLYALRVSRFSNSGLDGAPQFPNSNRDETLPARGPGGQVLERGAEMPRNSVPGKPVGLTSELRQSVLTQAFDGSTVPLAIALAGSWLSNVPLGVMAVYLLGSLALLAAIANKSWAPMLRAVVGGALGLGLAAVYLLPAAFERNWVDVSQATQDPGYNFENNWLYVRHSDPWFAAHDVVNRQASWIAVSMLVVAMVSFLIAWRRGTLTSPTHSRRWWIPLAAIPVWIAFLSFPISRAVWHGMPEMPFIQYPWRWLEAVEGPMAIFFVAAIWPAARRIRIAVAAACALGCIAALVYANRSYFQACYPEDAVPGMLAAYRAGAGFEGLYEYAPPGSDISNLARNLPDGCLVSDRDEVLGKPDPDDPSANPIFAPKQDSGQDSCAATFQFAGEAAGREALNPEHLRLAGSAQQPGYVVLRLLDFPAWEIKLNGHLVHVDLGDAQHTRPDGLIAIRVNPGPINLTIDWTAQADAQHGTSGVLMGRSVSAISLLLAILIAWRERRRVSGC